MELKELLCKEDVETQSPQRTQRKNIYIER